MQNLVASLPHDPALFRKVYRYAFTAGKEPGQKALSLENALVYWGMLFSASSPGWAWQSVAAAPPTSASGTSTRSGKRSTSHHHHQQPPTVTVDWLDLWTIFLQEKWTRSVSRDMWNMALEFALKSVEDESLSFWSEDGAWPGVIDEFVVWCKDVKGVGASGGMDVDH